MVGTWLEVLAEAHSEDGYLANDLYFHLMGWDDEVADEDEDDDEEEQPEVRGPNMQSMQSIPDHDVPQYAHGNGANLRAYLNTKFELVRCVRIACHHYKYQPR